VNKDVDLYKVVVFDLTKLKQSLKAIYWVVKVCAGIWTEQNDAVRSEGY